jgi:hypothetical protein
VKSRDEIIESMMEMRGVDEAMAQRIHASMLEDGPSPGRLQEPHRDL